ncbi:transcriptional regulator, PadR family [Streptomyces sp. MnatMP-M77]|nr:transcriptional regulator, PadR family [Streptomyces sp. MnatMP-M77]
MAPPPRAAEREGPLPKAHVPQGILHRMEPGDAGKQARAAAQLRKGVLEYCVLALMRDRPRYGVELLHALEESGALATSQGTVYPLLSRLRRDDLVTTTWQESDSGPPRRYYALTEGGRAALDEFAHVWPGFRDAVDAFLATPRTSNGDSA